MRTHTTEKLSTNRKKVIGELIQGREFATQLQTLLHKPSGDHGGSLSAEELVVKISRSFTETLSALSSYESGEVSQNPSTSHVGSLRFDNRRSDDSGESRNNQALKDPRGCYKRRKTNSQTWTTISPTLEDSHAWRKYGQKEILNAKYPRSYFRCTHKYDQGCRATKQVQRIEQDPHKYQTTYIGYHTCRDILKVPQIISDFDTGESYLISFESKNPSKQDIPSVKEESKQEAQSDLSDNLSSLDSILWPDLMALESSGTAMMLSPYMGSDHWDIASGVYSRTATGTSHSLDMDFMVRSVDFDCDFHFNDEIEF